MTGSNDDMVLAVAMACWYGEYYAGSPVFRGCFNPDAHVARTDLGPEIGPPIIRGWHVTEPVAVVWFQVDRSRCCRVLNEHVPTTGEGLREVKSMVLSASNILFPGSGSRTMGNFAGSGRTGRILAERSPQSRDCAAR
jgi:hypothetical protein